MNHVIDWKAPKTGKVERDYFGYQVVLWHNGQRELLSGRKLKEKHYGKPRYEIIK